MLFKTPGHALRWAYQTTDRSIVKISSVHGMRGASGNGELTAHDRHAQAALIMGLCDRTLNPLQIAYIKAQFGRDAAGFVLLANHLAANLSTGLYNRRALEQIIRGYCGERFVLSDMQASMNVRFQKAVDIRNHGYSVLDKLHSQAMAVLWREMESSELIEIVA